MQVEVARAGQHRPTLMLLGTVRPALTVQLAVPRDGMIVYPKRFVAGLMTGVEVSAGETLARLENEQSRLALAEAQLAAEAAAADLERGRRAFEQGLISRVEFAQQEIADRLERERLASVERESRRLTLVAPYAGRLMVEQVFPPGSAVSAGTSLAELAVSGRPRVEAWVAAADRERLRPGLLARFTLPSDKQPAGEGRVREVAGVVDAAGAVRVVAEFSGQGELPAPGEGVEMTVELDPREGALTVPETSLVVGGGGYALFVVDGVGASLRAARRPVEVGQRGGGRIEILRGLEAGESFVVSGAALLGDGARITVSNVEPPVAPAAPAPPAG